MPSPYVKELRGRRSMVPLGAGKGTLSYERRYQAVGYTDEAAARAALGTAITLMPSSINGAPLVSLELDEELRKDLLTFVGRWELENATGFTPPDAAAKFDISFDAGTTTTKATQSFSTILKVGPTSEGGAPDFFGAIGVSESGIDGVDVITGQWSEEATFYVPPDKVTVAFKRSLFLLVGTVNEDDFGAYRAGECRFDGARGSQQNGGNFQIALRFSGRANGTLPAVDDVPEIDKDGWDYAWYYRRPEFMAVSGGTESIKFYKAKYGYVERIYRRTAFGFLQDITAAIPGA